jgi:phage-related tail fiber protein
MSKVTISGNVNGTGTFTIASPNGNTDRTLTLPDATGTIATVEAASLPAGSVIWFAANAAPTGYLKANGATVSRTTYAALFAAIGTTFGAGDGSTTFVLPELRGEFIRGWADGRAVDTGRAFGSAQTDDLKSHNHTFTGGTNGPSNPGGFAGNGSAFNTSSVGGTETRPRNIALLACIKF